MTTVAPATKVERTAVIYARVSTKEQAERDGDPDGYSIPAQRDACTRKADSLEADVAAIFIDRGESARSADRPELQKMLSYLIANPTSFVIVHKVDRLARNRSDDVTITAAIAATGAKLVSVTENIDETPSGLLLHGIMSSIAEFYSRNLAAEVIKGTQQKVLAGGTPSRAPLGYLNVRRLVDGYETRTVELDEARAPLVRWAFETYAEGTWSLNALAQALEDRGLKTRPSARSAAGPVPANKLHQILRNRYYIGVVTWRGVEHVGKHDKLVDVETFETVQRLLSERRTSGERAYKREHYLVGSLRCGRCSEKLLYTVTKGRASWYGYFYCASRTDGDRKGCGLRYLPEALVEQAVVLQWQSESLPAEDLVFLRQELTAELSTQLATAEKEVAQLEQRQQTVKRERFKWAEKAMNGAVPDDIAAEKQAQLAIQLLAIERELAQLGRLGKGHEQGLATVLVLIQDAGATYQRVNEGVRRSLNQAWFDYLVVDEADDEIRVMDPSRSELTAAIHGAIGRKNRGNNDKRRPSNGSGGVDTVRGSNINLMVGAEGLEPPTPCV